MDLWPKDVDIIINDTILPIEKKDQILLIKCIKQNTSKIEILSYVNKYYNNERMHTSLDYLTPNEFDLKYS
jgi:hypothetical protein